MKKLIDKFLIFIICSILYIINAYNPYMIVPILIVLIISGALSYFESDSVTLIVFAAYLVLCFSKPEFLFFIPLLCYDAVLIKFSWAWLLAFIPPLANFINMGFPINWLIAGLSAVAYILKHRTVTLDKLEEDYYKLRDNTKEISMQLEKHNKELLEKQDYEINLATLRERNRIARDIHDNVGHLLSRSILQIGALLAINKEETAKESLSLLKGTLSEAMDSIRASVHDLHEEAVDLQAEIEKLIHNFTYCPVSLQYDVEANLDKNIKYCFIAIVKEALSNIAKHSNGDGALIIVREHPAIYQLVIQDNGTQSKYIGHKGIGIKNMNERVSSLGGNINISTDKGFRIFISIPKK